MMKCLTNIEIHGYIIATERDRHGNPTEIAVETEDFKKFIVKQDGKGDALCNLLSEEVSIQGEITGNNIQGTPIIEVSQYEVIDPFPLH